MGEDSNLLFLLFCVGVGLTVFYFIIEYAVRNATKAIQKDLSLLIKLKIEELKKEGLGGEIDKIQYNIKELEKLDQSRRDGYITYKQYEEKKKQLLN